MVAILNAILITPITQERQGVIIQILIVEAFQICKNILYGIQIMVH